MAATNVKGGAFDVARRFGKEDDPVINEALPRMRSCIDTAREALGFVPRQIFTM
jgi:hypothetical protein